MYYILLFLLELDGIGLVVFLILHNWKPRVKELNPQYVMVPGFELR